MEPLRTDTLPSRNPAAARAGWGPRFMRVASWLLAAACFYLVYGRIAATAAREQLGVLAYLSGFFAKVDWALWLLLMIPYSVFFFLVDANATWRAVRWFNAPALQYRQVLPIRASAFILSLLNEQIGKGAMSVYLLRRYGVPGWEALSTMILLGLMEIYQLLMFAALGTVLYMDLVRQASTLLPLTTILVSVVVVAALYLPLHIAYFRGVILANVHWRDARIFHAFRQARPYHYAAIILMKAPSLIAAVLVYTAALALFHVDVVFGQMLAFLPVIFLAAALPLPFHAGALLLWTVLFPQFPEVGAFSLVMHTFFVSFNAVIGLLFLPRANRELFVDVIEAAPAEPPR